MLFLNFLRGMETYKKTVWNTKVVYFLNFLRGMETISGRSADSSGDPS